jgi:hypothetical protein
MTDAAILLATLLLSVISFRPADRTKLPGVCGNVDFTATGRPIVFPFKTDVSIGLSAPSRSVRSGAPLTLIVWAINETETEQYLISCTDVDRWVWGLGVYDSTSRRLESRRETKLKATSSGKLRLELSKCYRNFALPIPPRSCKPLIDNNHAASIDLARLYELPAGRYLVRPQKQREANGALEISIAPHGAH